MWENMLAAERCWDSRGQFPWEQVKKFRELADELHESIVLKGVGDFIPVLKWFNMGGLTKWLQNLKKKMDVSMSKLISEQFFISKIHG